MRKRYIVTILTALAMVAYLALDDHQASIEIVAQDLIDQEPDYIIESFNAQSYGEGGELSQQVTAHKATHYPGDDSTILEKPSMILYEAGVPKWGVRSVSGRFLKQTSITLAGGVIIVPLNPAGGDFSLTTDSLDIDLASQMADTDDDVVIESDTSELLATGMTILLDQQFVKFKSHVRGRHDPQAQ
ncbi:MAG: LPS export ABC transporter periplasmic protein LptC [Bermanella sp.]|nr:LPS export ABC transporter periplasmic protein LptC [Bermanella sp.]